MGYPYGILEDICSLGALELGPSCWGVGGVGKLFRPADAEAEADAEKEEEQEEEQE